MKERVSTKELPFKQDKDDIALLHYLIKEGFDELALEVGETMDDKEIFDSWISKMGKVTNIALIERLQNTVNINHFFTQTKDEWFRWDDFQDLSSIKMLVELHKAERINLLTKRDTSDFTCIESLKHYLYYDAPIVKSHPRPKPERLRLLESIETKA